MSPIRLHLTSIGKLASRLVRTGLAVLLSCGLVAQVGADLIGEISAVPVESGILPEPVTEEHFSALMEHSPFLRSVGLSESLILTGIARIENHVYATLLDTKTTKSHVVSESTNPQGWQLVGVRGDEDDLESLTAKIQVAGGEVLSIRYEKLPQKSGNGKPGSGSSRGGSGSSRLSSDQMKQAKYHAYNYKGEHPADGYPKSPPPDVVKKLSKMSVPQRESLNREMIGLRNRGLGMEQRQKIYNEKIDRALQGR